MSLEPSESCRLRAADAESDSLPHEPRGITIGATIALPA